MKRWLLGAALAAAGAAGVSPTAPVSTPCGDLGGEGLRCVTVRVAENRARPGDRTIALRVAVLRARGSRRAVDPVFILAGGPGAAATASIGGYLDDPRRETRDFVFMDQRGTGGSHDLRCRFYLPEDAARGVFPDFMPVARVRACRAELEPHADLAQYTTAATVADLEQVRQALGYQRINLEGSSYGTRLAMEYVRLHGARVRAVVLEGVVPPDLVMPDAFGRNAQRALDAILAECAASPACNGAFPDLGRRTVDVFARLARAPARIPAQDGWPAFTMTRDNVAEAVRYMTYSTAQASRVPLVLHRAHAGDFSGLAAFLRHFRGAGTFDGLYLSVTCAEDVPLLPRDAAAHDRGTYLGDYRIRQQQAACAEWPRGASRASREVIRSPVPALLVTGALDPVTPPAYLGVVAAGLPNSVSVAVPSGGHALRGLTNLACIPGLKTVFVERGSAAGLDTSCVATMARAGFALQ
jgi:pimeloyl-ACP methyl ester carboxylesterase